jgi:ABC-type transport system involved in multi-copper enzyme maturation permease subunit
MTTLVRTELLKIALTRSTWGFLAVALALAVARVEAVIRGVGKSGSAAPGSFELAAAVLGASGTGMIMILLLGAVSVTREFHHATLTSTLLTTPDRRNVVAAKVLAAMVVGVAAAAALFAFATARAVVSVDVVLAGHRELLGLVASGLVAAAFWGWLGAALGLLVRSQTVAVVLPIVWLVVVETLLPAFGLRSVVPWTPGGATAALTGADVAGALPVWAAAVALTSYALLFTVPGAGRLERSDIT